VSVSTNALALHQRPFTLQSLRTRLNGDLAFSAAWAAQSRLASISLFAFIAFSSLWITMGVMLAWSLAATVVYFVARSYGAPDMLEMRLEAPQRDHLKASFLRAVSTVLRIAFVGPAAFVYTRLLNLKAPGACHRRQAQHAIVLATGVTLFGVTTTHYILRKGGFSGAGLLQLSCVGSVLNVTWRTLLSAVMFAGAMDLVRLTGLTRLF